MISRAMTQPENTCACFVYVLPEFMWARFYCSINSFSLIEFCKTDNIYILKFLMLEKKKPKCSVILDFQL